jgi:hypothetical protein
MRKIALALAATAISIAAPAQAAILTTNYSFTGSATGTFSLDCDDASDVCSLSAFDMLLGTTTFDTSNAGLIVVNDGGFPVSSVVGYQIGGTPSGVNGLTVGPTSVDDFLFFFANPRTTPVTVGFTTVLAGSQSGASGQITISLAAANSVPEPAAWALMLLGFGAIGVAMRRRKVSGAAGHLTGATGVLVAGSRHALTFNR